MHGFKMVSFGLIFVLSLALSASSPFVDEQKIQSAVVKVYTVVKEPDYTIPWSSRIRQVSGSGAIIEGRRILTNAHVVANQTFIEVQRFGERKRYIAHVEAVSHQLDLALLKVEDPQFFQGIAPLRLGGLPRMEQQVSVYGYPVGGETLSVTSGVVSRIEHQRYVHSGESFLAIQIDAAVNPGNSGGPAISRGKIVGVVMEGIEKAQSISYLIPTVMIRHFLHDIADGRLDGVPALGVLVQPMQNPSLRAYYRMERNESGVLVDQSIESLGAGPIAPGDILTRIENHPIQNDSTVAFRRHEYTNFNYYVELHQMGERIRIQIDRNGTRQTVRPLLHHTSDDFLLVKSYRYDRMPRYFILGGYVFMPLTRNLLSRIGGNPMLRAYAGELVSKRRKEVVLLARVLPSALSRGDYRYAYWPIEKINGKRFDSFDSFYSMIRSTKRRFIVLENRFGRRVVIDRIKALKEQKRILRRYNIEYDRSEDLRTDASSS